MSISTTKNTRVEEVFNSFIKHMQGFLDEQKLNHEEYTEFVKWADRLGRKGEIPLFMDVFIETHVLNARYSDKPGTEPSLLGPYFVEGAPMLEEQPFVLPQRPDEEGEKLVFKGKITNLDGLPLANTHVDMWQDDNDGKYSNFDSPAPEFNLRGQFYTDDNGEFEVHTIVPIPYQIPTDGPTGEFLGYTEQHAFRPAHLHLKFEHEGYETLITQVFFEGDKWLDSDVAGGVRDSLLTKLHDEGDHKAASLDFVMRDDK